MKPGLRIVVLLTLVLSVTAICMFIDFETALPYVQKYYSTAMVGHHATPVSSHEMQAESKGMMKDLDMLAAKKELDALKEFFEGDAKSQGEKPRSGQANEETSQRRGTSERKESAVNPREMETTTNSAKHNISGLQRQSPPMEEAEVAQVKNDSSKGALAERMPSDKENSRERAVPSVPIAVPVRMNPRTSVAPSNISHSSMDLSFMNNGWQQPTSPRKFDSVVFLKLHKVGSTTFSAFLEDTASQNGLVACDFYPCGPLGNYTCLNDETPETMASKGYKKCHVWVSHGVETAYRRGGMKLIRKWFPNALTIILLRDPVDRFLSRYYYDLALGTSTVEEVGTLNEYVMGMTSYEQHYLKTLSFLKDEIKTAEENLEEFDVVGLTEEFDHAVTLTALYMGWNISAVRYTNQKIVVGRPKVEEQSPELIERLRRLLHGDIPIYEHAKSLQAAKRKPFPAAGYDQSLKVFKHFSNSVSATDLREGGDEGAGCKYRHADFKFGHGNDCLKFKDTSDDSRKK